MKWTTVPRMSASHSPAVVLELGLGLGLGLGVDLGLELELGLVDEHNRPHVSLSGAIDRIQAPTRKKKKGTFHRAC
jgi:hypothetical protein